MIETCKKARCFEIVIEIILSIKAAKVSKQARHGEQLQLRPIRLENLKSIILIQINRMLTIEVT